MLLGLLLPDPCDPHCPEDFKVKARELLPKVQGNPGPDDMDLRKSLLKFIGDFSNWDLSTNQTYLEVSRSLVKAAHPEETPLVVDPFAGGGSIPLEALRLGCETFASDLNPVACLILKVMLEDIPRYGPGVADELRRVGKEIKEAAEKELREFYPEDSDGSKPIAYLWARTVRCESPNCGAEIPLVRSFWLCKKASRKRALRYLVESVGATLCGRPGEGQAQRPSPTKTIRFEIFEPKNDNEVSPGTVTRAKATCLCCGNVLAPERVRAQLSAQRGGADVVFDEKGNRIGGARLLAVVTLRPDEQGRHYRLPISADYYAVWKAEKKLQEILNEWKQSGKNSLCPVPNEPTPAGGGSGAGRAFSVQKYGMMTFGDLFTARQKLALVKLGKHASAIANKVLKSLVAFSLSKESDFNSSLSRWANHMEKSVATFGRQALPILWDWGEVVPVSNATGAFEVAVNWIAAACAKINFSTDLSAQVQLADACTSFLPDSTARLWFTDPPYYDAVPYADLSDFFFVWLKRVLSGDSLLCDLFDSKNPLTPKTQEIVQDEVKRVDGRPKDRAFFEEMMSKAFAAGRRVLQDDGLGCVVFAHKTTEGWEALLSGLIRGGWIITGSWPVATEKPDRMRAQESAALGTSVHLVCRPRPHPIPLPMGEGMGVRELVGDWGEVLRELPERVGDWMERLQSEGVRGADLVFACIGPALEIYSRYSKVETAEGREVGLPEFLEKVWEVVGRSALEQVLGTAEAQARNSTAGALEEDARLTALFLWTLQSTNGESPSPRPSPRGRGGESEGSPKRRGREIVDSPEEERGGEFEEEEEEEEAPKKRKQGYSLIFDVVRRFAQPLGIHLPEWEGRIIETEKGVVRLLSVKERAKQLFGEESVSVAGIRIEEQARRDPQMKFDFALGGGVDPKIKGRRFKSPQPPFFKGGKSEDFAKRGKKGAFVQGRKEGIKRETTTLDRVHAAMLLQASGQTNALRALLKAEQERGPDFLRLANALSALYPKQSEEKRLLDAMLLAIPR
jgi:adenine-specific DNA methylase